MIRSDKKKEKKPKENASVKFVKSRIKSQLRKDFVKAAAQSLEEKPIITLSQHSKMVRDTNKILKNAPLYQPEKAFDSTYDRFKQVLGKDQKNQFIKGAKYFGVGMKAYKVVKDFFEEPTKKGARTIVDDLTVDAIKAGGKKAAEFFVKKILPRAAGPLVTAAEFLFLCENAEGNADIPPQALKRVELTNQPKKLTVSVETKKFFDNFQFQTDDQIKLMNELQKSFGDEAFSDEFMTRASHQFNNINQNVTSTDANLENSKNKIEALQELQKFTNSMGQFGAQINCPVLSHSSTILGAGLQIGIGIATLQIANLGVCAALGGVGAIVAGGTMILSLFLGGGVDQTMILLRRIDFLSDQIESLGRFVEAGFQSIQESQKVILQNVIHVGSLILQACQNQTEGSRIEIMSKLESIQKTLNFVSGYLQNSQMQLFSKELMSDLLNADNILLSLGPQVSTEMVEQVAQKLLNHAKETAKHPLLNGVLLYESIKNSQDFVTENKFLQQINERNILGNLAYFAYQGSDWLESSKVVNTLPHLEIWKVCIEKYTKLISMYPHIQVDKDHLQLNIIEKHGDKVIQFLETLTKSTDFFEKLLVSYDEKLNEIFDTYGEFGKAYSDQMRQTLNIQYLQNNIEDQEARTEIEALNFLEPPENLINQFSNRTIAHVSPIKMDHIGRLKSNELISGPMKTLLPKRYLAEEFLEVRKFKVIQTQPVNVTFVKAFDVYMKNPPKPRDQSEYLIWHARSYKSGTLGIGSGWKCPHEDGETVKLPLRANDPERIQELSDIIYEPNWQLTLALLDERNTMLAKFVYQDNWKRYGKSDPWGNELSFINVKVNDSTEISASPYLKIKRPQDTPGAYCSHTLSDDSATQLSKDVQKFIAYCWERPVTERPDRRCIQTELSQQTNIENILHQKYISERKAIALHLLGKKAGHLENIVQRFKNKLIELDNLVTLIRCFAYLAGKNINDAIFEELITQNHIKIALENYVDKENVDINDEIIPTKFKVKTIIPESILMIPDSPSSLHPRNFVKQGQLQLQLFKYYMQLQKIELPTFSNPINVVMYRREMDLARRNHFETRIFAVLERIIANNFQTAINDLNSYFTHVSDHLSPELYLEYYRRIINWAEVESKAVIFTLLNPGSVILDLNNVNNQQLIFMRSHQGWSYIVGSLMEYAKTTCKYSVEMKDLPDINLDFWQEGVWAFLDLIVFNPLVKHAAKQAKNTSEKRMNALESLFDLGFRFRKKLLLVARSPEILRNLFDGYLASLDELIRFLKPRENPLEILRQDIWTGSRERKLNHLEVLSCWINSFAEMIFGYQMIEFQSELSLLRLSREQGFISYIENKRNQSPNVSVIDVLTEYCDKVQTLKNTLIGLLNYLSDYTIFIENLKLSKTSLTISQQLNNTTLQENLQLIQIMTKEENELKSIQIENASLTPAILNQLIISFSNCKQLESLSFDNVNLTEETILILRSNLPKLNSLKYLSIKHEDFNLNSKMSSLTSMLYALPKLQTIDLSYNDFKNDHLGMLQQALRFHQQVCVTLLGLKFHGYSFYSTGKFAHFRGIQFIFEKPQTESTIPLVETNDWYKIYCKQPLPFGQPILDETLDAIERGIAYEKLQVTKNTLKNQISQTFHGKTKKNVDSTTSKHEIKSALK